MDAADKTQVKKREREELNERQKQLTDIRDVLSTRQGRRFIYRLLGESGLMGTLIDRDPIMLAQSVGRHDFGSFLLKEILEAKPGVFAEMILEATQRSENEESEENG